MNFSLIQFGCLESFSGISLRRIKRGNAFSTFSARSTYNKKSLSHATFQNKFKNSIRNICSFFLKSIHCDYHYKQRILYICKQKILYQLDFRKPKECNSHQHGLSLQVSLSLYSLDIINSQTNLKKECSTVNGPFPF